MMHINNIDFQTPIWVCEIMVGLVKGYPKTILEPTPGAGNLVNVIKTKFPNSTIYAPDRFETLGDIHVDYIIANPPFTPTKESYIWMSKFFESSNNIIVLMPWWSIINSQKRTKEYVNWGLKRIIHLPRKAFPGIRVQTCVLVFQRGYRGDIIFKDA